MRGLFVTATDTNVGKTVLSASLLAAIAARGERVRAHKPAVTGLDEPAPPWPPDHELLAGIAAMRPDEVAPLRYGPAVSPHLAARLDRRARAGRAAAPEGARDRALATRQRDAQGFLQRALAARDSARALDAVLVVEGVGGLLCPLADDLAVRDLAAALGLPLLIAARPGLGTISHTLLTIEAARAARLCVSAVVLTPWPARPSVIERSNRETIATLGRVEVALLPLVARPQRSGLARAGARLPWRRWLAPQAEAEPARPARAAASIASVTHASSSSSITYAGIV
jgi:dethiobiotin synthetase